MSICKKCGEDRSSETHEVHCLFPARLQREQLRANPQCSVCNNPKSSKEHKTTCLKPNNIPEICANCQKDKNSEEHDRLCLKPLRERKAAIRAKGICTECGFPGNSNDHDRLCLAPLRLRQRELSASGICGACKEPTNSALHSQKCLSPLNVKRAIFSSNGLCRDCKAPFASDTHENQCLAKRRASSGLCSRCKHPLDSREHALCKVKSNEVHKLARRRAVAAGLCGSHPTRLAVIGNDCEECWFKSMSQSALGTKKKGPLVKELFEAQHKKCFYTGDILIPGDNASLDHIVPRARGGPEDIRNVHWVTFAVNQAKASKTEDEFLLVCQYNYQLHANTPLATFLTLDKFTQLFVRVWKHRLMTTQPSN